MRFLPYLLVVLSFWPGNNLSSQEINPDRLAHLLAEAEKFHSEAVIIYSGDSLITESYFGKGHPEKLIQTMSCSKNIVALAVLCLLDDGLLDNLETPVCTYYPEWQSPPKSLITIEHLLNMTSGIRNDRITTEEIYASGDFVQLALRAEIVEEPGSTFRYNNKSCNLLAGLVEKITGKRMDRYISERLFEPLGISEFEWQLDSAGNPHAMSGCGLKPRDFIKFGLLIANDGYYNDRQVISKEVVAKLFTAPAGSPLCLMWWPIESYQVKKDIMKELMRLGANKGHLDYIEKLIDFFNRNQEYCVSIGADLLHKWWKYVSILQPNNLAQIYRTVLPENKITELRMASEVKAISARGWLGNYLCVDKENEIVAVRMISYKSFVSESELGVGEDNFYFFERQVWELKKP